ncbi:unnamed protein product [Pleuronectes platessa]|uniref:Uncharacterized protein n=1 Tax=Pleuronectes platessa TaxID=8262 RepID=A0A9N7UA74_PLEPL|nr:unnamed protein product [Pleuronectes platessa]
MDTRSRGVFWDPSHPDVEAPPPGLTSVVAELGLGGRAEEIWEIRGRGVGENPDYSGRIPAKPRPSSRGPLRRTPLLRVRFSPPGSAQRIELCAVLEPD